MTTETNLSDRFRKDLIYFLCTFSNNSDNKSFKSITRQDILRFLDSFRRHETSDPLHKWIGTYNIYRLHLLRFFKALYYPDIEQEKKTKTTCSREYT
jgi:hypothetical protein